MQAPYKPRFQELKHGSQYRVTIPARKNWFIVVFLSIWLFVWTIGGGAIVSTIIYTPNEESLFLLVWSIGWAIGWIFAVVVLIWQIFGHEEIRFDKLGLKVKKIAIFEFWGKDFSAAHIENFQLHPNAGASVFGLMESRNIIGLWFGQPSIKFAYGARDVNICMGLDQAEARHILDNVKMILPKAFADSSIESHCD